MSSKTQFSNSNQKSSGKQLPQSITLVYSVKHSGYVIPEKFEHKFVLSRNPILEEAGLVKALIKRPGEDTCLVATKELTPIVGAMEEARLVRAAKALVEKKAKSAEKEEKNEVIRNIALSLNEGANVVDINHNPATGLKLKELCALTKIIDAANVKISAAIGTERRQVFWKNLLKDMASRIQVAIVSVAREYARNVPNPVVLETQLSTAGVPLFIARKLWDGSQVWDPKESLEGVFFPKKMAKHLYLSAKELLSPRIIGVCRLIDPMVVKYKDLDPQSLLKLPLKEDGTVDTASAESLALQESRVYLTPPSSLKERLTYFKSPHTPVAISELGTALTRFSQAYANMTCGFTCPGFPPVGFLEHVVSIKIDEKTAVSARDQAQDGDYKAELGTSETYFRDFFQEVVRYGSIAEKNAFEALIVNGFLKEPVNLQYTNPPVDNNPLHLHRCNDVTRWTEYSKTDAAQRIVSFKTSQEVKSMEEKSSIKGRGGTNRLFAAAKEAVKMINNDHGWNYLTVPVTNFLGSFRYRKFQDQAANKVIGAIQGQGGNIDSESSEEEDGGEF